MHFEVVYLMILIIFNAKRIIGLIFSEMVIGCEKKVSYTLRNFTKTFIDF